MVTWLLIYSNFTVCLRQSIESLGTGPRLRKSKFIWLSLTNTSFLNSLNKKKGKQKFIARLIFQFSYTQKKHVPLQYNRWNGTISIRYNGKSIKWNGDRWLKWSQTISRRKTRTRKKFIFTKNRQWMSFNYWWFSIFDKNRSRWNARSYIHTPTYTYTPQNNFTNIFMSLIKLWMKQCYV